MKPSTPSASAPEQTIPVKAESVEQEVGEDYQARERQRQGMISTILARRHSSAGQGRSIRGLCLGKLWDRRCHGRKSCGIEFRVQVPGRPARAMGDVVGPSKGLRAASPPESGREVSLPNRDAMDRMTDTTAVEACQKLASGHMSYITPSHDVWFKWSAPDDRGGDEAEAWYNQCSEIALKELSVSNFYTEIHECFLDRVALGTGSLFTGTSSDGRLLFTNIPCGQFACAENAEGRVDTYVREFAYTAHQARSMFGVKALGPKAREVLERGGNPYATTLRFLHVVRPRTRRSRRREQASHMPFESVYLSLDDQVIVEEGDTWSSLIW